MKIRSQDLTKLLVLSLVLGVAAALLGTFEIPVGPSVIVLFPLVWAILLGALVSVQPWWRLSHRTQRSALALMEIGIVIFLANLGTSVGPALGELVQAGPAILLQELGNIFGSVLIALPIAVLLRCRRASIGATWSIDRESNLAYISEKYGPDSSEFHGTLVVWAIGSVFGALYISLLAGLLAGLDVFDPRALVLASGIGSTSMMLGGTAAVSALYPGMEDQLVAFAAASNSITNSIGKFVSFFVALPLAAVLYRFWSRIFRVPERSVGQSSPDDTESAKLASTSAHATPSAPVHDPEGLGLAHTAIEHQQQEATSTRHLRLRSIALIAALMGVVMVATNIAAQRSFHPESLVGIAILVAGTIVAYALRRVLSWLPAAAVVIVLTTLLSATFWPVGPTLQPFFDSLDFMAMGVPAIVLVGLGLGKDLPILRRTGPALAVVAFVTFTTTFLAAALIAQPLL